MTELFLIALLASGLTVLMWGNVTELAEACRERVKKWALSFKEETGSEGKIKFKAESAKLNGKKRFYIGEAAVLCEILHIDDCAERCKIFLN